MGGIGVQPVCCEGNYYYSIGSTAGVSRYIVKLWKEPGGPTRVVVDLHGLFPAYAAGGGSISAVDFVIHEAEKRFYILCQSSLGPPTFAPWARIVSCGLDGSAPTTVWSKADGLGLGYDIFFTATEVVSMPQNLALNRANGKLYMGYGALWEVAAGGVERRVTPYTAGTKYAIDYMKDPWINDQIMFHGGCVYWAHAAYKAADDGGDPFFGSARIFKCDVLSGVTTVVWRDTTEVLALSDVYACCMDIDPELQKFYLCRKNHNVCTVPFAGGTRTDLPGFQGTTHAQYAVSIDKAIGKIFGGNISSDVRAKLSNGSGKIGLGHTGSPKHIRIFGGNRPC